MIKVEALSTYEDNKVTDSVLGKIPKKGEKFEVTAERYEILTGKNANKLTYVKKIEENKKNINENKKK